MTGERRELEILESIDAGGLSEREQLQLLEELDGMHPRFSGGPVGQAVGGIGLGVNTGLADALGAPVDLTNAVLSLAGLGAERPIGGSARFRTFLEGVGFGYEDRADLPEEIRPFAAAGEVVGGSVPFAAAPLAAARAGVTGGRFLEPIVRAAGARPAATMAVEAGTTTGAAIGRALGEAVAPGDELAGMGMEILGGFLHPAALISHGGGMVRRRITRIRGALSRSGREQAAGDFLRRELAESGEDVDDIVRRLEEPATVPGTRLTTGQLADSPTLQAIELGLFRRNSGLQERVRQDIRETFVALRGAMDDAAGSGNPDLVRQIAEERDRYFGDLLEARIAQAREDAVAAADRMRAVTGRDDTAQSVRLQLETAHGDALDAERRLWEAIPRDLEVAPTSLRTQYDAARAELLPEEALPAPVEAVMARLDEAETITSGELLRLRSRLLEMQRQARSGATPDFGLSRRLGMLVEGVLDDLAETGVEGVDAARAFSRRRHDLFTRGEVGRIMRFEATGGEAVPSELTLQPVGRGGQRGAIASRQIEDAAQLEGLDVPTRQTTMGDQEQFVRHMLAEAIDPNTGEVNPTRLARIAEQNRELLDRFPQLRPFVEDAVQAQNALREIVRSSGLSPQELQQRALFARIADFEDPVRGVAAVLDPGGQPFRQYRELAEMVRSEGGQAAVDGLRRATIDHLMRQAIDPGTQRISGQRLRRVLEDVYGGRRLDTLMLETGVMTPEQATNLNHIISEIERIEEATSAGRRVIDLNDEVTALEDLGERLLGARLGSELTGSGGMSGHGLIFSYAGSRFVRDIMQRVPQNRVAQILAEAVHNPRLMQALLTRGRTPAERRALERQVNAFLLQTGVPGPQEPPDQAPEE